MASVTCPHCGASNPAGAMFCEACGKAVPPLVKSSPRVVTAADLPATAAGSQMLGDQLLKHTKRAANTLMVVGILQIVIGGFVGLVAMNLRRGPQLDAAHAQMAIVIALGLIFLGLSLWARRSPLPAAIVGLVLYSTLILLNVIRTIGAVSTAGEGTRGTGIGGLGVGWIDIVIVFFLAQGIKAALDHRTLLRAQTVA